MRIMTYNIRLGIQEGLSPIGRIITEAQADLVALQEVGRNWSYGPEGDTASTLARLTGLEHMVHVPAIEEEHRGKPSFYGHALLSRWPIMDYSIVDLPQLADEPRRLLFSIIDSPSGYLKVLSTHLSHRDTDRPAQSTDLLDRVCNWLEEDGSHFLVGDLNADPSEPWIGELQTMMSDADRSAGRLTFPANAPRLRIDYLFCREGQWSQVEVLEESTASDHRPVVATWRREPRG
jgi:endonuclease/exonuclease/phosphatase family metal-dependent hydrolase